MAGNTQRKLTIGVAPLSYLGVNAESPPNTVLLQTQDPTTGDYQNFIIGDIWIHSDQTVSPNVFRVWMLVGLARQSAVWVELTGSGGTGTVNTLTGNAGGPVPALAGNINVVGDTTTIQVVGNPGTNTLTISAITGGNVIVNTLTGNSGGPVSPLGGNINVVGDGTTINVVGNPGTHTLTISAVTGGNPIVSSIRTIMPLNPTDVFAASNGEISIVGDGSTIAVRGNLSPNTVTISAIGTGVVSSFLTDNGTADPIGGQIEIHSTPNSGSSTSFSASTNVIQLNVTDANSNTLIGNLAGSAGLTAAGSNNTALGKTVLHTLATGTNNIAIGVNSGSAYTGAESYNTLLANAGVIGESQKMRLGTNSNGGGTGTNATYLVGNVLIADPPTGVADFPVSTSTIPLCITSSTNSAQWIRCNNGSPMNLDIAGAIHFLRDIGGAAVGVGNSVMNLITQPFDGTNYIMVGGIRSRIDTVAPGAITWHMEFNMGNGGSIPNQQRMTINTYGNIVFTGAIMGVTLNSPNSYTDVIAGGPIPLYIDSSGNIGPNPSSEKYKENISEFDSSAIYKLKPVSFNFKGHEAKDYGFIAEDVAEVIPEIARYKDGEVEGFNADRLVPMLLQEIQKLNKRIEALEN